MPRKTEIINNENKVDAVPRANRVGRMRWVMEALISRGRVFSAPASRVVRANSS